MKTGQSKNPLAKGTLKVLKLFKGSTVKYQLSEPQASHMCPQQVETKEDSDHLEILLCNQMRRMPLGLGDVVRDGFHRTQVRSPPSTQTFRGSGWLQGRRTHFKLDMLWDTDTSMGVCNKLTLLCIHLQEIFYQKITDDSCVG